MDNLPRALTRHNPRYTHRINSGVLFDLGRMLMDCDVHVASITAPTAREARAKITLNAMPVRELWDRLQSANVLEENGEWPAYKLTDEFGVWFQPDPYDCDVLTISFRLRAGGCDL